MSGITRKLFLHLAAIGVMALFTSHVCGTSIPNDGIPDFYYFPSDGLTQQTSFGDITRPAGTLTVDTDGLSFDMIAVFVSGPDVSLPPNGAGLPGCDLCDELSGFAKNLPQTPAGVGSNWTTGFSQGSTQWVRTSPLSGLGFRGVIGTGYITTDTSTTVNTWPTDFPPFFVVPDFGLANYGPGLTEADFPGLFDDGSGTLFNVRFATDDGRDLFGNVTVVVPEPVSLSLAGIGLLCVARLRRR